MATHDLCFNCYRQIERELEREQDKEPGRRREKKKTLRAFTALLAAASDLGFDTDEMYALRGLANPHIASIASLLSPEPEDTLEALETLYPESVNSERGKAKLVHTIKAIEEKR